MIALYSSTNPAHAGKLVVTYNGLSLHSPSDALDDTYEIDSAPIHTNFAAIADERPTGDGMEIYEARKISKMVRLNLRVRAPSRAKMFDKIETLAAATDPALVSFQNPTSLGFIALDFSVPTTDTANYASGYIPSRYYVRPLDGLNHLPSRYSGLNLLVPVDFMARDPRRYLQTTASQTGAGTLTNIGTYPSPATVTITATGAGSATYAVRNDATVNDSSLVLNLSGLINADVVVVDMDARTILKNGTSTPSLYVSGNFWPGIEPGSNAITITNGTNTTSVVQYRRAFSL